MTDKDKDSRYVRLHGWTRRGSRPQDVYVLKTAVMSAAALELVELFQRVETVEERTER